jgi:hypothetical protein
LRHADGTDEDVGGADNRWDIDRPRVAHCDGAVATKEQLGHWTAHNVRPTEHDAVLAVEVNALSVEHVQHPLWGARDEIWQRCPSLEQLARVDHMEPIDILQQATTKAW